MTRLAPGEEAPDFTAAAQGGQRIRLREFRGQWVILYFYPKDRTYGCTREACSFRDEHAAFRAEGAAVIGVSRDSVESHDEFAAQHNLPFPLIADRGSTILDAYSARAWYGWSKRVTYLIDPSGRIAKRYAHVNPAGHAAQILQDIRRLKLERNTHVPIQTKGV